jgi:hypothetical protein
MVAQGTERLGSRGVTPTSRTAATAAEPKPVPLALLATGPATDGTGAPLANRASPILMQGPSRGQARRSGGPRAERAILGLQAGNHGKRAEDALDLRPISGPGRMPREPPEIVRVAFR